MYVHMYVYMSVYLTVWPKLSCSLQLFMIQGLEGKDSKESIHKWW